MILTALTIGGFGRLRDRHFTFASGVNVVYGQNESGKSTLSNAIIASLYGVERRKESWRPWTGGAFATTLMYRLANGEEIEVQRDYERDAKGLRVYDRSGNEISGRLGAARVAPGVAHLGMPLEVFLNAACVKQQGVAIPMGRTAGPTAEHLARALDGGPCEDAARGAIERLDAALRIHIGTQLARKNAPLRGLRERAEVLRSESDAGRRRLAELDAIRDRLQRAAHDCERYGAAAAEIERRGRSLRAGRIATRLAGLREFRVELAELQRACAAYDDVAAFSLHAERDADEAYYAWRGAEAAVAAAESEVAGSELTPAECAELSHINELTGDVDDPHFARLQAAHDASMTARTRGGAPIALAVIVSAVALSAGFAAAHWATWTACAAAAGIVAAVAALSHGAMTAHRRRDVELVALRARRVQLQERQGQAERRTARLRETQAAAAAAAVRFDGLAAALLDSAPADRAVRKLRIAERARRRRERDGIEAHLHALELQRSTILGGDEEPELETELADLVRGGAEAVDGGPGALRALEGERGVVGDALRAARDEQARLGGQIAGLHVQVPDLAELDERFAHVQAEIGRLEAFERAVTLAKSTVEIRTAEAHAAFARQLETDASTALAAITAGRYRAIFVDPTTLTIRVRVPETQSIEDLESLSAGTRDQAYLVVRFAMARMFAQGAETPPLLLDDPFAFWDAERIERCLPIVEYAAREGQAILFTSSVELADEARARGAYRIDLPRPVLAA